MDIKEKDIENFRKHAAALRRLIKKINKYAPKANYYLANETLNLMKGPSHTGQHGIHQDNVVDAESLWHASGGDW